MLVKEKNDKIFLFELELSVEYQSQILISCEYSMAGNSNYRRLSENEKLFARSRKAKFLTAGIH